MVKKEDVGERFKVQRPGQIPAVWFRAGGRSLEERTVAMASLDSSLTKKLYTVFTDLD